MKYYEWITPLVFVILYDVARRKPYDSFIDDPAKNHLLTTLVELVNLKGHETSKDTQKCTSKIHRYLLASATVLYH